MQNLLNMQTSLWLHSAQHAAMLILRLLQTSWLRSPGQRGWVSAVPWLGPEVTGVPHFSVQCIIATLNAKCTPCEQKEWQFPSKV